MLVKPCPVLPVVIVLGGQGTQKVAPILSWTVSLGHGVQGSSPLLEMLPARQKGLHWSRDHAPRSAVECPVGQWLQRRDPIPAIIKRIQLENTNIVFDVIVHLF
jgi:hypothetical protein